MRKVVLVVVVCAFSSVPFANAATLDNGATPNVRAAYSTLQKSAGVKQCIVKYIKKCIRNTKRKLECRTVSVCVAVRG